MQVSTKDKYFNCMQAIKAIASLHNYYVLAWTIVTSTKILCWPIMFCRRKYCLSTVMPTKSDSDIHFCLQFLSKH